MLNNNDKKIIALIKETINESQDFWDYKKNYKKKHIHSIIEYPATMIPIMQAELMKIIMSVDNDIENVMDPFMGSGTVLIEGMLKKCHLVGIDINPLAYLITKVKITPIVADILKLKVNQLYDRIDKITRFDIIDFDNIDKWFKKEVIFDLSRIKTAIMLEEDVNYRRVFWISFCNIIRSSCNSRKTTYKLHIKRATDIVNFNYDCISSFKVNIDMVETKIIDFQHILNSKGISSDYLFKNKIYNGDAIDILSDRNEFENNSIDFISTSPPYGDNHTTVSYGQYSILQLKCMDLNDIEENLDNSIVSKYSMLDRRSLGGTNYTCEDIIKTQILVVSPTLKSLYYKLITCNKIEKARKIASFYIDFEKVLCKCFQVLRVNKYAVFTVGNRRVNNEIVEFNKIFCELAENMNTVLIHELTRNIRNNRTLPNIRKVNSNEKVKSMKEEYILIFRKKDVSKLVIS